MVLCFYISETLPPLSWVVRLAFFIKRQIYITSVILDRMKFRDLPLSLNALGP